MRECKRTVPGQLCNRLQALSFFENCEICALLTRRLSAALGLGRRPRRGRDPPASCAPFLHLQAGFEPPPPGPPPVCRRSPAAGRRQFSPSATRPPPPTEAPRAGRRP